MTKIKSKRLKNAVRPDKILKNFRTQKFFPFSLEGFSILNLPKRPSKKLSAKLVKTCAPQLMFGYRTSFNLIRKSM